MSDLDDATTALRAALATIPDQLRPQDAYDLIGDLAYLTPLIGALADRVAASLTTAERIPGLYTTTPGGDPAVELRQAGLALHAARQAGDVMIGHLTAAHNVLSALGHSDTTADPLHVATNDDEGDPPRHPGWTRNP